MKHTLLFLLLFMFSCSSEPSTPYKLYCTDVLIEQKCVTSLGGGKQCERTGNYKIMKEVEGE